MVPYIIRQGDYITKLASRFGFDADTVWNDPANADLKKARGKPDVLSPGDVLFIPEPKRKFLPVTIGSVNKFKATVPTTTVRLTLTVDGQPLANTPCRLEGTGEQEPQKLQTGGDGSLTFSLPMHCQSPLIVIDDPPVRYPILVGHMDPHDEASGVRKRLVNLGYLDDVEADPETTAASLSVFQSQNGIEPTGELDDDTRAKLVDVHGH